VKKVCKMDTNLGGDEFLRKSMWLQNRQPKNLDLVRFDRTHRQLCRVIGSIETDRLLLSTVGNYGSDPAIKLEDACFVFAVGPPNAVHIAKYGEEIIDCYERAIRCAEELSQTADDEGQGKVFYHEANKAIFKFEKAVFEKVVSVRLSISDHTAI